MKETHVRNSNYLISRKSSSSGLPSAIYKSTMKYSDYPVESVFLESATPVIEPIATCTAVR